MSRTSRSAEPGWLPGAVRIGGLVVLVAIQGGCGLVMHGLYRLSVLSMVASREARRAAAVEAVAAQAGIAFPSVMGYVDHFDDDAVAVMTAQTLMRVRVDGLTLFRTPDRLASPSDLHPGAGVVVSGDEDGDGGVLADVVVVRPAP